MSADGGQCTQLWATLYPGPDRSAMGMGTDHDHRVDYRSDPLGRLSDMRLGMTVGLVGYFTPWHLRPSRKDVSTSKIAFFRLANNAVPSNLS